MTNDAMKSKVFKNSKHSHFVLLGCETMQSGRWVPAFLKNTPTLKMHAVYTSDTLMWQLPDCIMSQARRQQYDTKQMI